jgi:hypothetical protein
VRQRRRKQPSADFVMESIDDLRPAEVSGSPKDVSERAPVVRAGKSR